MDKSENISYLEHLIDRYILRQKFRNRTFEREKTSKTKYFKDKTFYRHGTFLRQEISKTGNILREDISNTEISKIEQI